MNWQSFPELGRQRPASARCRPFGSVCVGAERTPSGPQPPAPACPPTARAANRWPEGGHGASGPLAPDHTGRLCRHGRMPGAYRDAAKAWRIPKKAFFAYRRARAVLKGPQKQPNRAVCQQLTPKSPGDIIWSDNWVFGACFEGIYRHRGSGPGLPALNPLWSTAYVRRQT